MASPLVHIGYHRTGTTWFQDRFYPAVTNGVFVPRKLARRVLIEPGAYAFSPDRAREELEAFAGGRRLLICEENLSGYLHNGGFNGLLSKEVARRLKATFPDATIVAFIRSQPRMIEACYSQYVRAGGTHSIERYLRFRESAVAIEKYWYKYPQFSFDHFLYAPLLDDYRSLFGESVQVHLFEQFAEDQKRFVADYAERNRLDVDLAALDFAPVNSSLHGGRLKLLARLNLLTAHSVPDKRYFLDFERWYRLRLKLIGKLGSPSKERQRSLLSLELTAWIERHYAPSNARLMRDWKLPLADYGYPLPND